MAHGDRLAAPERPTPLVAELLRVAVRLLHDAGELSVLTPADVESRLRVALRRQPARPLQVQDGDG